MRRQITLTGGASAELILARNSNDQTFAVVRPEALSLGELLQAPALSNLVAPEIAFLIAPSRSSDTALDVAALPAPVRAALTWYPTGQEITLAPGVNVFSRVPLSVLPAPLARMLGMNPQGDIPVQGVMDGYAGMRLIARPQLRAPRFDALPALFENPSLDEPVIEIASTITGAMLRFTGEVGATVNGRAIRFSAETLAPLGRGASRLELHLNSEQSFGVPGLPDGVMLDTPTARIGLGGAGLQAEVSGALVVGGDSFGVTVGVAGEGSPFVRFSAERAGSRELAGLLEALGRTELARRLPEFDALRDLELMLRPGEGGTLQGRRVINRELDGEMRRFDVAMRLALGSGAGNMRLSGRMDGEWRQPFGLDWLDLSNVGILLEGEREAAFYANMAVGGTQTRVELGFDADGARLSGSASQLGFADLDRFLREGLGASPLAPLRRSAIANQRFRDLRFEIGLGKTKAFSIGGVARHQGRDAPFLISARKGVGKSQAVFGLRLDQFSLADASSTLKGTLAEELYFDKAALLVAATGGRLSPSEMNEAERAFYQGLISGEDAAAIPFGDGLSLLAALPVQEGDFLHGPLGVVGSPQETLLLAGSIPNFLAGGGGALSLAARLPPMRPSFGEKAEPPAWFRSGQLGFVVRLPSKGGPPMIGLEGRMTVFVDDREMAFLVGGSFGGTPLGVTLSGGMIADEPWRRPFGVGWLTLEKVGAQIGVSPKGLDLGFTGNTAIGGKTLRVDTLIGVSPAGVPNNIAFAGSSDSPLGFDDIIQTLQLMIVAAKKTDDRKDPPDLSAALAALPRLEIRPLDAATPMSINFALLPYESELISIESGLRISGALHGTWSARGPSARLAQVDASLGIEGVALESSVNQDIKIDRLQLQDAFLRLDLRTFPPEAALKVRGDLSTPWFRRRINVDVGGEAPLADGLLKVIDILDASGRFTVEFAKQPINAVKNAIAGPNGIFATAGVNQPVWLKHFMEMVGQVSKGSDASPKDLLNDLLRGAPIRIPAGPGLPLGGVEPEACPVIAPFRQGGKCWFSTPAKGEERARTQQCVTSGGVFLVNGVCYLVPPGATDRVARARLCIPTLKGRKCTYSPCVPPYKADGAECVANLPAVKAPSPSPKSVCLGIEISGRCYNATKLPRLGAPKDGIDTKCPAFRPVFVNDRCWAIPPTPKIQTGRLPAMCKAIGIPCEGDVVGHFGRAVTAVVGGATATLIKPFEVR